MHQRACGAPCLIARKLALLRHPAVQKRCCLRRPTRGVPSIVVLFYCPASLLLPLPYCPCLTALPDCSCLTAPALLLLPYCPCLTALPYCLPYCPASLPCLLFFFPTLPSGTAFRHFLPSLPSCPPFSALPCHTAIHAIVYHGLKARWRAAMPRSRSRRFCRTAPLARASRLESKVAGCVAALAACCALLLC